MDALAFRTTVRDMVAAFVAAERDVRAAFAQLVAAQDAVNLVFSNGDTGRIYVSACGTSYRDNFADADAAVAIMTRQAWRVIVDRLELQRFCSIARWKEIENQLDREKLPAITEQNVLDFYRHHASQAREMLTEAVREVWEWLRPRKGTQVGDLKTNTEMEVGERVILGYAVSLAFMGGFQLNSYTRQRAIALENVFNGLAGNGTICKGWKSLLETAIDDSKDGAGETELFAFRACKNGNLHLRFKRLDLLARFNAIAAGKTLRPVETDEQRLRREIAAAKAENERLKRTRAA